MKIRIKKFKLRYCGETFAAGAVLDIPEKDVQALMQANPEQFECMPAEKNATLATDTAPDTEDINLDSMTVAQLKEFAKENGIDIGDASKKQDIIDTIVAAAEPQEPEGLPQVDLKGTVK